jgi:hypothetical protein
VVVRTAAMLAGMSIYQTINMQHNCLCLNVCRSKKIYLPHGPDVVLKPQSGRKGADWRRLEEVQESQVDSHCIPDTRCCTRHPYH